MINQPYIGQNRPEKASLDWNTPLPDEKPLWFSRYCLYRDLGPKRSLRAAIAKEQERFTLLPPEQAATESHEKPLEKKPVHVSGSWKQASVTFCWKERCKLFDQAIIQTLSQDRLNEMGKSMANQFARVEQLGTMAAMVHKYIMDVRNRRLMDHKEAIAYMRLLRDLVKDIRVEMRGIDDQALLQGVEWFTSACYYTENWTPEKSPFMDEAQEFQPESRPNFFQSVVEAILKVKREARDERL